VGYECELAQAVPAGAGGPGIWRWSETLPVDSRYGVSLGEGDTPLVRVPRVARDVGVAELYVKNEAANPTGSHKDRLATVAIAAARQSGAQIVTGASTGNHGAALAAYCAQAGLRCVIVTTAAITDPMRASIQVTGAELVMAADPEARYGLLETAAERGWLVATNATSPPVGSPAIAVEGYKTIAYEIWEQLDGAAPEWMVVPVSYGCCLAGVQRGFAELAGAGLIDRPPRLAAVEPFGALQAAIASDGAVLGPVGSPPTAAFSIAVRYTTDRAWRAVTATNGVAVTVSEDELLDEQLRFGGLSGLYAEVSSSITIAAARRLVSEGTIAPSASVVCLLTATGLKDPGTTLRRLPEP
jgi:threonine synthase